MIAQLFLTAGLLVFVGYTLTSPFLRSFTKWILVLIPMAGIGLIWSPESANRVAAAVGIGRGADLLLYCWVIVSLLIAFVLNARVHLLHRELTDLTRSIALNNAKAPTDNGSTDDHSTDDNSTDDSSTADSPELTK